MYRVSFITTEQEDDLIVSFAVVSGDLPGDILSLTLLRTPKFEFILDSEEEGVSVSWEKDEDENELLLAVERSGVTVKLSTTKRLLTLDISRVDGRELRSMNEVLQKMNFDNKLKLRGL